MTGRWQPARSLYFDKQVKKATYSSKTIRKETQDEGGSSTRLVHTVVISLDNPDLTLKPSMMADAKFEKYTARLNIPLIVTKSSYFCCSFFKLTRYDGDC